MTLQSLLESDDPTKALPELRELHAVEYKSNRRLIVFCGELEYPLEPILRALIKVLEEREFSYQEMCVARTFRKFAEEYRCLQILGIAANSNRYNLEPEKIEELYIGLTTTPPHGQDAALRKDVDAAGTGAGTSCPPKEEKSND